MEKEPPGHSQGQFLYILYRSALNHLEYCYYLSARKKSEIQETIRYISEALVWSEQNHFTFLDEFKFRNTLSLFSKILSEIKAKDLQIQLIQSANILMHNLSKIEDKSKKKLGFLLASDFYTLLVTLKFDFSDDEIVENYMSFLKGMAANLPNILLFSYVVHTKFAFFSKAFNFFSHKDPMLRNAARTGILKIVRLNEKTVDDYLTRTGFVQEVFEKVVNHWKKFQLLVKRGESFSREFFISSISDDLCYLSDLLESSEEMSLEVNNKFITTCFPWIMSKIEEIRKNNENFNGVGFILVCIFDFLRSSYILNILASALFSALVPEKILVMIKGNSNIKFDLLDDELKCLNEIKHSVLSIVKFGKNTAGVLVLINKVIGNALISKKILFECTLLLKEDVRSQCLIRKILYDVSVYTSDTVLASLLVKVLISDQPWFHMFLAARVVYLCRLFPESTFLPLLKEKLGTRMLEMVSKVKDLVRAETVNSATFLEIFENESKSFKMVKIENKVKFPSDLMHPVDTKTLLKYRLPVGNKEILSWYLSSLLLIGFLQSNVLAEKGFLCFDDVLMASEGNGSGFLQKYDCKNNTKVMVSHFFVNIERNSEVTKIRTSSLKVSPENDPLILNLNSEKDNFFFQIDFLSTEDSVSCKKNIERMKKDIRQIEFNQVMRYLDSFNINN